MVSYGTPVDCSALADMTGFQEYMQLIRNETKFNTTLLGFCQNEICGALWGVGNPDVSGIGVTAGYVVEIVLGFLLAVCCHLRRNIDSRPWKWLRIWAKKPLERGFETFFTSAFYFAMSILVASNYALAKRDFDVSANGFGIIETQITFAITVASVLPLLYPITMGPEKEKEAGPSDPIAEMRAEYNSTLHEKFRLVLSGLVIALFTYPFVSQCIHNWAPTDVGEDNGPGGTTIVDSAEWAALTATCFGEVHPITDVENKVISAFELAGSLLAILVVLCNFFGFLLGRRNTEKSEDAVAGRILVSTRRMLERARFPSSVRLLFHIVFLLGPLLLSIPLLWGIFRLREVQRALAKATTNLYLDNDWTFGQVVAIAIFAPVLFDMVHCSFELE